MKKESPRTEFGKEVCMVTEYICDLCGETINYEEISRCCSCGKHHCLTCFTNVMCNTIIDSYFLLPEHETKDGCFTPYWLCSECWIKYRYLINKLREMENEKAEILALILNKEE